MEDAVRRAPEGRKIYSRYYTSWSSSEWSMLWVLCAHSINLLEEFDSQDFTHQTAQFAPAMKTSQSVKIVCPLTVQT